MALVPYIELPDMPGSVQAHMQRVPPLNIITALANSEAVASGLIDLGGAVISAGTLDKQLKELIVLRVGFNSSAKYEVSSTGRSRESSTSHPKTSRRSKAAPRSRSSRRWSATSCG
jgi:hypothetical protein